ncbi:MAG: GGDEF domain-containing protein [Deltaproteobacteria bacterium]|nr:GGDEF domain-containing protein [Deltaproteobacteria bacterium]
MADFPRKQGHLSQEQLLKGFLNIIKRCQSELIDLDRSEIQFSCLTNLASVVSGSSAILMLASDNGSQLDLELASSPLTCDPNLLHLRLSVDDQEKIFLSASRLATLSCFSKMAAAAFGRDDLFARALVQENRIVGALLLVPPKDRPLSAEENEILHPLAAQIDTILESAEVFASMLQQSMIDDLTGMFNHRYYRNRIPAELSRASRHGHPLSLLFCEVDDFGIYVQENGRLAANLLISEFGQYLKSRPHRDDILFCFRASDIPVRFGENQFIVILPETPKDGAITKAKRLAQAVESTPFIGRQSQPSGKVTVSVGIASFPDSASDAVAILEAADQALLQASKNGGNQVVAV